MQKSIGFGFLFVLIPSITDSWATWSDPPIINSIQAVYGRVNLDLGSQGINQPVTMFLVNSNDPAGFHLNFTFANKGKFISGSSELSITSVVLNAVSGTLGAGLTPISTNYALTVDGTTGIATWSAGGSPTGATINYLISISVNWSDQPSIVAGFYKEGVLPEIYSGP